MRKAAFAGAAVIAVFFAASVSAAGLETYDVPTAHALPARLAVDAEGAGGH